jgi:hypothetical protein
MLLFIATFWISLLKWCFLYPIGLFACVMGVVGAYLAVFEPEENYKKFRIAGGVILFAISIGIPCYVIYKDFIFDYSVSIGKAVERQDFEKAHDLLIEMSQDSDDAGKGDFWTGRKKSKYTIAYEKVFKAETTYLLNQHNPESSDRLISLISDLPLGATPAIGVTEDSDTQKLNEEYLIYAGKFNSICDDILQNAIGTNNRYLAEKILALYKPSLSKTLTESHLFSANAYKYDYTNEAQVAAHNRFDEAIKAGSFH